MRILAQDAPRVQDVVFQESEGKHRKPRRCLKTGWQLGLLPVNEFYTNNVPRPGKHKANLKVFPVQQVSLF